VATCEDYIHTSFHDVEEAKFFVEVTFLC
jgi:hypothetical protein